MTESARAGPAGIAGIARWPLAVRAGRCLELPREHVPVPSPRRFRPATLSSWISRTAPRQPRPEGQGRGHSFEDAGGHERSPELSAPQPNGRARTRSLGNAVDDEPNAPDNDGPLLALPNVNLPPIEDPGVPFGTRPAQPATTAISDASAATAPDAVTTTAPASRDPERSFQQPGMELDASLATPDGTVNAAPRSTRAPVARRPLWSIVRARARPPTPIDLDVVARPVDAKQRRSCHNQGRD